MTTTQAPPDAHLRPTHTNVGRGLWRDPLLLSAVVLCGLLLGYQLVVTLLRPPWLTPATDWLLTVLAWPELAVIVFVSFQLTRAHQPSARAWWFVSGGMLCYAAARTVWTVDEQLLHYHSIPFPSVPDLVFALQYPFFIVAILLIPRTPQAGPRLITFLDGLLFLGSVAAISWYFVLAPLFTGSWLSPLGRVVSLTYPLGDLLLLVALTVILFRPSRYHVSRQALSILVASVICLIVGDSLAVALVLHPQHVFRRGDLPDLLWMASDLLAPLAALVWLRWAQRAPLAPAPRRAPMRIQWDDFVASLRFFAPFVVALLASAAILVRSVLTMVDTGSRGLITPLVVGLGLLLLVIVRQEITFLVNTRLQREREEVRATTQALRELNRRKDEFLSIVSHELKTPLTSLRGYIELIARRLSALTTRQLVAEAGEVEALARSLAKMRVAIQSAGESLVRMTRLIDDLLDTTRIQEGRMTLRVESCDLRTVVQTAVEEQRLLSPQRTIRLDLPATRPVPVLADTMRIGQVVTNYITNALKYSTEDRPVEICLKAEDGQGAAYVAVRDKGIGIPEVALASVWERFQRVEGNEVQSGSGIGLGIGLSIVKHIVEAHHGQVGVHSTVGEGSTFWFTLPLVPSSRDGTASMQAGTQISTPISTETEAQVDSQDGTIRADSPRIQST